MGRPDPATVAAACADPAALEECVGLPYRLRLAGPGPAIMSVLPVLVLLVLADGLRLGRRFAWWAATGLSLGLALLGAVLAVSAASSRTDRLVAFGGADDPQFHLGAATTVVQPLLIVALLVATRTQFRIAAPDRAWRGPALVVTGALFATSIAHLVGSLLVADQYTPVATGAALLADLPTRFLPPGYLGEVEIAFLPTGPVAAVLYTWTGVTFWTVTLVATM